MKIGVATVERLLMPKGDLSNYMELNESRSRSSICHGRAKPEDALPMAWRKALTLSSQLRCRFALAE